MPEPEVDAALLEGMFVRAVRPTDVMVTELRAIGIDVARLVGKYPLKAWHEAIQIARRQLYPDLPEEQAFRELGNLFVEGYFDTIIGKVLAIPLVFLSPEKIIERIPRTFRAGRADLQVDPPKQEGPRKWRVTFRDSQPMPGFVAGIVLGGARRTANGKNSRVDIENASSGQFDIVISW